MTVLNERSKEIRRETLKLSKANGGYHYGGCFSAVEILIALYDHILTENDRFILSKGHACWPYYVLLREEDYDPKLLGHPERDVGNGIHCTTGSEGHGLPTGIGMAMAKKLRNEGGRIFVLMGDGECQEGTTWESLLIAAHHKLDNLTVIVDWNECQGSGWVDSILALPNMQAVAFAMGWTHVAIDGHSMKELETILPIEFTKPYLVIAETVKGKGVSYMEGDPDWHANWPDEEHFNRAIEELL